MIDLDAIATARTHDEVRAILDAQLPIGLTTNTVAERAWGMELIARFLRLLSEDLHHDAVEAQRLDPLMEWATRWITGDATADENDLVRSSELTRTAMCLRPAMQTALMRWTLVIASAMKRGDATPDDYQGDWVLVTPEPKAGRDRQNPQQVAEWLFRLRVRGDTLYDIGRTEVERTPGRYVGDSPNMRRKRAASAIDKQIRRAERLLTV